MSCWPVGASRVAEAACPAPAPLAGAAADADAALGAATPAPSAAWAAGAPAAAAVDSLLDPPLEQPASAAMAMTMSPGTKATPSRRRRAPICLFRMPLGRRRGRRRLRAQVTIRTPFLCPGRAVLEPGNVKRKGFLGIGRRFGC